MLQSQGLRQGATKQGRRKEEHRCDLINPSTGQLCNTPFTRRSNLNRHKREQHQDQSVDSINQDPTGGQHNMATPATTAIQLPRIPILDLPLSLAPMRETETAHSLTQTTQAPWRPAPVMPSSILPRMEVFRPSPWIPQTLAQESLLLPSNRSQSILPPPSRAEPIRTSTASKSPSTSPETGPSRNLPQPANRSTLADSHSAEEPHSAEEAEDQASQTNATEHGTLSSHTDWTDGFESDSESDETASDTFEPDIEEHASGHETLSEGPGCTCRKRKRPRVTGRTIDADRKADVPTYRVKRSKKTPGQQRGLDWLSAAGKDHFDNTLEVLLAQWGVKAGHRGTCVLLPEDWKALEPVDLMAIFQNHELPSGSGRAWYSYSDHATSLGRAAAWFGSWPHKAADLDQFLNCGPYKPKDGSHLCHHEHCIVHLVYESAAKNQERWNCREEARFLRRDDIEVPEHCTKHSPPCLMQVSYLERKEEFC